MKTGDLTNVPLVAALKRLQAETAAILDKAFKGAL
jgi:hypothetical protein